MSNNRFNRIVLIITLSSIIVHSCGKHETYDLFPLKAGNEFYYNYQKRTEMIYTYTIGIESWKVVSDFQQGDSIVYVVERNLKAKTIIPALKDTMDINETTQFLISEKRSSSLISFMGFKFKRYQDIPSIELNSQGYSTMPSSRCTFKSDSGLIKYYYYHPPNQVKYISMFLDSLKVLP